MKREHREQGMSTGRGDKEIEKSDREGRERRQRKERIYVAKRQ